MSPQPRKHGLALFSGWLLGPGAWALHENAGYVAVPYACEHDAAWPLYAAVGVPFAIAMAGVILSARWLARLKQSERAPGARHEPGAADPDGRVLRRGHLQLYVGLGLSIASCAAIALGAIGIFWIDHCTGV
jgi:hypothetical protein